MPVSQSSKSTFGSFYKASKPSVPADADILVEQVPYGIRAITDFQTIEGDQEKKVGTIGYSFKFGNVTYEARFLSDNGGNEIEEFKILIPATSRFLRDNSPILTAEKLYIRTVIDYLADKTWVVGHLKRLTNACFDKVPREVEFVVPTEDDIRSSLSTPLFAHTVLNFPSDANYRNTPEISVVAFEYRNDYLRYVVDISKYPKVSFQISDYKTDPLLATDMYQLTAKECIEQLKLAAKHDRNLAMIVGKKGFIETLEMEAEKLQLFAQDLDSLTFRMP